MKEQEIKVSAKQVREMAEMSEVNERVLKEMFPQAFEQEEYFFFGQSFAISTCFNGPLVIGYGFAKRGHRLRVLLVDPEWKVEVVENYDDGKTGILLKRVQKQQSNNLTTTQDGR